MFIYKLNKLKSTTKKFHKNESKITWKYWCTCPPSSRRLKNLPRWISERISRSSNARFFLQCVLQVNPTCPWKANRNFCSEHECPVGFWTLQKLSRESFVPKYLQIFNFYKRIAWSTWIRLLSRAFGWKQIIWDENRWYRWVQTRGPPWNNRL
jgi:hypothetical protein